MNCIKIVVNDEIRVAWAGSGRYVPFQTRDGDEKYVEYRRLADHETGGEVYRTMAELRQREGLWEK